MREILKEEKELFEHLSIIILIGLIVISLIVWFISMDLQSTELERMKHQFCTIETTTYLDKRVEVVEYCGPNAVMK